MLKQHNSHMAPQQHRLFGYLTTDNSMLLALITCVCCILLFALSTDKLFHWSIIPLIVAGTLIGSDAIRWLRGRVDLLDPIGIIGVFGFHFFFLAPVLHIAWDYWMSSVTPPQDWREWIGGMAVLNCIGLILYRMAYNAISLQHTPIRRVKQWLIDYRRLAIILPLALLVTSGLQCWIYMEKGGILGYIISYTLERREAFQGMGWLFMISESMPILAMAGYIIYARRRGQQVSWISLICILVAFFVARMLFGGLRGSRSNTLWAMFWAVGMIHLWLRPVPRRFVYVGLVFAFGFIYIYGLYKGAGLEVTRAMEGAEARAELAQQTGRSIPNVILGDLAHSDVQAYLFYRLWTQPDNYRLAWGETYVGAASLLIPRAVLPDRPPTKIRAGTEAQYGKDSFIPDTFFSSRVYGIAGEAMLNFGPLAVPFAYLLFGIAVGRIRYGISHLTPQDCRWLLVPFLIYMCFVLFTGDSDNLIFATVKNGMVPYVVLLLSSRRITTGHQLMLATHTPVGSDQT